MNTQEITQILTAQPTLEPGTEGWWKVWGATPMHIRKGDVIAYRTSEGTASEWLFIEDTFLPPSHPARVGLQANGERFTLGALCRIVLMRQGTHNTLAD